MTDDDALDVPIVELRELDHFREALAVQDAIMADQSRLRRTPEEVASAKRVVMRCEHCGEELYDVWRSTRRYCSGRCRVAALRARRAQNGPEPRRSDTPDPNRPAWAVRSVTPTR